MNNAVVAQLVPLLPLRLEPAMALWIAGTRRYFVCHNTLHVFLQCVIDCGTSGWGVAKGAVPIPLDPKPYIITRIGFGA